MKRENHLITATRMALGLPLVRKKSEPLPDHLAQTLAAMNRHSTYTSYDLAAIIQGITPNAQNNRLEKLRALGFVVRQRFGKFWRYSLAPKRKAK